MDFITFLHVITHAAVGAIFTSFLLLRQKTTIFKRITVIFIGAVAGIMPDLPLYPYELGHSVLSSLILAMPITFFLKLTLKQLKISILWYYSLLSILIGHLFIDILEHPLKLFYPFSKESLVFNVLLIGDPWFLLPLIIFLLLVLFNINKRAVLFALIIISFAYLGIRFTTKEMAVSKIEATYKDNSVNRIINVGPPAQNIIDYSIPLNWLKWSFDIYSENRAIRGYSSLSGNEINVHANFFYNYPGEVIADERTLYRKSLIQNEKRYLVIYEGEIQNNNYIICKNDEKQFIVFQMNINSWSELNQKEADKILSQLDLR